MSDRDEWYDYYHETAFTRRGSYGGGRGGGGIILIALVLIVAGLWVMLSGHHDLLPSFAPSQTTPVTTHLSD